MQDTWKPTTRPRYLRLQNALHWRCDLKFVVLLALRPKFPCCRNSFVDNITRYGAHVAAGIHRTMKTIVRLVEVLGREVRQGSPGELMVESTPSRQRRPPCKTNKEESDEAADAAALTYLLTYLGLSKRQMNPITSLSAWTR